MKAKILRKLRKLAADLPPLMFTEMWYGPSEGTGLNKIFRKTGHTEEKPVNHLERLKDAYKRGREDAAARYCADAKEQYKIQQKNKQSKKVFVDEAPSFKKALEEFV